MEPLNMNPRKVIKVSKKVFWVLLVAIIVIGGWFVLRMMRGGYSYSTGFGAVGPKMMTQSNSPEMLQSSMPPDYYRDYGSPDITDTREFMKKSYSGNFKTRDVSETARDSKSIIRDADGRIDNENVSIKYASISFVIPKSNLESFRDEMATITNKKLYIETISSENQLSTKQQIEKQDEMAKLSLAELQAQQKALSSAHAKTLSSLQKQLADIRTQLTYTKSSKASYSEGTPDYDKFAIQENNIYLQEQSLLQSINNENATYTNKNNDLKNYIAGANENIDNIKKTDEKFADNIETVNGYVNIQWITNWEMAKIFLPIHPTLLIIIILVVGWFLLRHKPYIPKVEFV